MLFKKKMIRWKGLKVNEESLIYWVSLQLKYNVNNAEKGSWFAYFSEKSFYVFFWTLMQETQFSNKNKVITLKFCLEFKIRWNLLNNIRCNSFFTQLCPFYAFSTLNQVKLFLHNTLCLWLTERICKALLTRKILQRRINNMNSSSKLARKISLFSFHSGKYNVGSWR